MPKFQRGQSGNPAGRPVGAKDIVPRSFRKLAAIFCAAHADNILTALEKGVTGRQSHRYLAILAALEKQHVEHSGEVNSVQRIVHEHYSSRAS